MLINTHMLMGRKIYENMDYDKKALLKETQFIWGNIKPDCALKYKLMKHYKDESFLMIINKIEFLSNLSIKDLYTTYTINKFNQELGVICHFLCDYFCLPHHQRWEFKSPGAVKDHVLYENDLNKFSKTHKVRKELNTSLTCDDIRMYICSLQKEYEGIVSYEKDLQYASHICNTIINLILDEVILNQKLKENIALAI